MKHMIIVSVSCPCCRNRRLFDVSLQTEGEIQIKCPICKSLIKIELHDQTIHTEQIGA